MDPIVVKIVELILAGVIGWLSSRTQNRTKADKSDVRSLRRLVRRVFGVINRHNTDLDAALDRHEVITQQLPDEHRPAFEAWEVGARFIADGLQGRLADLQLDSAIWEEDDGDDQGEPPAPAVTPGPLAQLGDLLRDALASRRQAAADRRADEPQEPAS